MYNYASVNVCSPSFSELCFLFLSWCTNGRLQAGAHSLRCCFLSEGRLSEAPLSSLGLYSCHAP
uniref:Uncharacterized protein n=1 Tax=Anguilla anguilla TaxID=7936 RepID=A0A0E9WI19_ANGAN